jgi:hypothetical protein
MISREWESRMGIGGLYSGILKMDNNIHWREPYGNALVL